MAYWLSIRPGLAVYLQAFRGLGPMDRDDVLQACLFSYWKNAGDLGAEPRAWLYRVARNAALDALKSAARRERRRDAGENGIVGGSESAEGLPSPYPGPEAQALRGEEEAFVRAFLDSLRDGERELLHLAFAEGMAYPEIARALGMPLGTVKWKMAALRKRLAACYRKEFG